MPRDQIEELEKIIFPQPAKTEKRFFIFFFWTSLVPIVLLFTAGYYTTAYLLEKEAFAKHTALAEQRHSELALFVEKLQAKTASWGTDGRIRELTQKIHDGGCSKIKGVCPVATELSDYLSKSKLPLDPSVGIIDILGVNGVVVASSDPSRIGVDESEQKTSFEMTKLLPFGQATYFPELVTEEEEFDGRLMVHLSTPVASTNNARLVGVLLAHTENKELNSIVAGNIGQTTESYIVNASKRMVTPSRFIPNAVLNVEVDTPPVRECNNHNLSFTGSYKDYRGVEVFGSSVCDPKLFGTLVVETDRDEVFISINSLRNTASAILAVVLILILGYAYLSGADIARGVKHIFPSKFSSAITLIVVVSIIIIATIGISFVFTENIRKFITNQKTSVISSLVEQQADRHLNHSEKQAFLNWQEPESQKKFQDFADEVLHSFQSVVAVQLHTTSGVLAWSSLQNADIGSNIEAREVEEALRIGETTSGASTSTIAALGVPTLIGVYIPILGKDKDVVGVAEVYVNTEEIALFTQNLKTVLWVGAFLALVLIFILLRYVFRQQDAKIVAQSEELAGVIEQSPIGIYTIMKDGTIETSNPAMVRESGAHDVSEIIGKNVFAMSHYRATGLDVLIKKGLSGIPFRKEVEIPSEEHGGKKAYHYYYGVPLKNTDGDVEHLLLMSEDITERKELEEKVHEYTQSLEARVNERTMAIRESEASLREAQQIAHLGNWNLDLTTNVLTWSDEVYRIFEIDKEKFGASYEAFLEAIHPEDRDLVNKTYADSTKNHTPYEIVHRLQMKDGRIKYVNETGQTFYDENGKAIRSIGTVQDITEGRKATDQIREEKAKAEALLASLGEGMIATDNETRIVTMNPAAEEMLGWKEEEVVGKVVTDVITAEYENGEIVPLEERAITKTISTGEMTQSDSLQFVGRNGRRIPVFVTINPVIINGKLSGTVSIFRDITNEKELEKTRRDLLSLASHQLRTPLSGTKWLIETLRKGIHGSLTKAQEEYLDEIYKINERMTTLVHDMLGVLRMEGDITPAKKETVSIPTLLGVVFESLNSAAKSKEITLSMNTGDAVEIETDPFLLQHILESFVANAINYSPAHSEVLVSVTKKNDEFIFSVKDAGIGIPVDEQRQIFKRFYRASNAKTYDTHGSGLGLYIAATLAKKIGAQLTFESEKDKGSTFSVRLPFPNHS